MLLQMMCFLDINNLTNRKKKTQLGQTIKGSCKFHLSI